MMHSFRLHSFRPSKIEEKKLWFVRQPFLFCYAFICVWLILCIAFASSRLMSSCCSPILSISWKRKYAIEKLWTKKLNLEFHKHCNFSLSLSLSSMTFVIVIDSYLYHHRLKNLMFLMNFYIQLCYFLFQHSNKNIIFVIIRFEKGKTKFHNHWHQH